MTKPKYKKGKQVSTMVEFASTSCQWYVLYIGDRKRIVHREMLKSQQYRTLLNWINHGALFKTIPIMKEEIEYE